jgi:tetratricopeptide (TPR) repeat protein
VGAKRFSEAEQILREVLAELPDDREALDLIGFALYFQDRSAEAEPYCRRAVELSPEHAYAWKGLGMHLIRLGRHDEGFRAVEHATELRPDWFDPHWDFLVMALQVGSPERFDAMMALAKARFPDAAARLAQLAARRPPA